MHKIIARNLKGDGIQLTIILDPKSIIIATWFKEASQLP